MDEQLNLSKTEEEIKIPVEKEEVHASVVKPLVTDEKKAELREKQKAAELRREQQQQERDKFIPLVTDLHQYRLGLNATKKSLGDSFAMVLVKEKIQKLEELEAREDIPEKEKQSLMKIAMMNLEDACLRYRDARFKGKVPERARHIMVESILKYTRNYLRQNMTAEPDTSLNYTNTRESLAQLFRQSGFSGLQNEMQRINGILAEEVPQTEEDFEKKKTEIGRHYRRIMESMRKYVGDTFRTSARTKKNYRVISEALTQLRMEYNKVSGMTKDKFDSIEKKGNTWRGMLDSRGKVLTGKDIKKGVRTTEGDSDANMTALYKALGFSCCLDYKQGQTIDVNKKGKAIRHKVSILDGVNGYTTKKEIMERAKHRNIEVIYSQKVVFDLISIQIMDMIAGVKNRTEESLGFKFKEVKNGERKAIQLYDVKILSTKGAFTTESAEQYNDNKQDGSFRIYNAYQEDRILRLIHYDYNFADAILRLTDQGLVESLSKSGMLLGEAQKSAMLDRLHAVQNGLRVDKKQGLRSGVYPAGADMEHLTKKQNDEAMKRVYKSFLEVNTPNYKLIDRSLLNDGRINIKKDAVRAQEYGKQKDKLGIKQDEPELTENERFVQAIGKGEKKETRSGKNRRRTKKEIEKSVKDLVRSYGKNPRPELVYLRDLILNYTKLDVTSAGMEEEIYRDVFQTHYKAQTNILNDKMVDAYDLFYEENPDDFIDLPDFFDEKNYKTKGNAVPAGYRAINNEFDALNNVLHGMKDIKEQLTNGKIECTEEEKLSGLAFVEQLELLFMGTKGNLQVPENAEIMSDENITYLYKGQRLLMTNTSSVPLFVHEPCIEDVRQGGLGDCYFLASVSSLVETNPNFIKDMMKDNGDTVTIRLYDKNKKPKYFKVKKSIPFQTNPNRPDPFAIGALWVQYLEKAYTLMQAGTEHFEDKLAKPIATVKSWLEPNKRDYDHIEAGLESNALLTLTGNEAREKFVSVGNLFDLFATNTDEHIRKFYSGNIKTVLKDIKKGMRDKKPMTAGTRPMLIGEGSGLNREEVARGIAAGHAYTILGVEMIEGREMIKLRNPWGFGGMGYTVQKDSDVLVTGWRDEMSYEPFYITPERFVAYFKDYTIG